MWVSLKARFVEDEEADRLADLGIRLADANVEYQNVYLNTDCIESFYDSSLEGHFNVRTLAGDIWTAVGNASDFLIALEDGA